ncbi:MAG: hypothetical protein HKN07_11150 [Acidimicrobiia bacterium]|nr:hypothetical protein [Acidimicrobiia bacterium]
MDSPTESVVISQRNSWLDRGLTPSWSELPKLYARVILGVIAAGATAFGAFVAMAIGFIVTTGCFFSCDDPQPLIGIPLLLASVGLAAVSLGSLWWAFVDRHWRTVLRVLLFLGAISAALLVVTAINQM